MCQYPVFSFYIYRTGFKICFHYAETFFNLPAAFVCLHDCFRLIFKICTDSIKPIILFFFRDALLIQTARKMFGNLALLCDMIRFNKSFRVILSFPINRSSASGNYFFRTFNLSVPDRPQIIPVFDGIRYNQLLLQGDGLCYSVNGHLLLLIDPAALVKNFFFVVFFIQLLKVKDFSGRVAGQIPPIRIKSP